MNARAVIILAALAVSCALAGRLLYHYFQLESYQFPGFFRTLKRNLLRSIIPGLILMLIWAVSAVILANYGNNISDWIIIPAESAVLILSGWIIGKLTSEKNAKKPLAFTPRMKRLYVVSILLFFVLLLLLAFAGKSYYPVSSGYTVNALIAFCLLFPFFLPVSIALAGLLAWPLEKLISELYFRDAQNILRERPDLIKIGITGSWGKTSVKFILGTILSEKYPTLVTPASFNTPMGVTKIIRTKLEPRHRVFVAEMGARHVGDIKEMCRLVHPQIGIITSVGPQHLDTFKTVERVAKTKYELVQALPKDGMSFFSDDKGLCLELYNRTKKDKTISGLDPETDDVWAENIRVSPDGSEFLLCRGHEKKLCRTELLGEISIRNILLAASVCLKIGMSMEQTARGISRIRPVEHRLQLTRSSGGITVIDDAFNSNIIGAGQAFRVLKEFPSRRIVVTPGMVELGDMEVEMNRELGRQMAECCDVAVLVGVKRSAPIEEGLREKGFPEGNIHIAASLEEAAEWIRRNAISGDTVLFENDLPDNYTE